MKTTIAILILIAGSFYAGMIADPKAACVNQYRATQASPEFEWTDTDVEAAADDLLDCINN